MENALGLAIEGIRPWVESETGMTLSGERFSRLQSAVEKVLGKRSGNIRAELELIVANQHRRSSFLDRLTTELTIGESFFFRNENHFRALRENVIPAVLQDNAREKTIRIWTAGCAGGEEPYSVAILLDQMKGSKGLPIADGQLPHEENQIGDRPAVIDDSWHIHILATDLNEEFLDRARQARYRQWSFRQTEINKDRNYFSVEGKDFCLVPRIRNSVRFASLNLAKDVYPSPLTGTLGLDLILFRNVAIYFKPEVTKAIIQRFHRALRPGGWLLLGETEVTSAPKEEFEVRRFNSATLFRKKVGREPVRGEALPMFDPPLAVVLQRPTSTAAFKTALPNWVPLPKVEKVTAPIETVTTSELVNQYLQQSNFAEAERTIQSVSNSHDRAVARLHYLRGLLACAENLRARKMLKTCLDEEPLLIEAHLLKATFAEEDGDLATAEQCYRRALFVDRKCAIAHFHLALVQKQLGNITGARRSLEIALELASGEDVHEAVPHGDGVCYGRLQEMAEGILDF